MFNKKKLKLIVLSISSFLAMLIFYTQAFAINLSEYYRFTPDIYDQERVLARISSNPSLSEDAINEELEKELLRRKEAHLDKNSLERIRETIKKLEGEFKVAQRAQFKSEMQQHLQQAFATIPLIGTSLGMIFSTTKLEPQIFTGIGAIAGAIVSVAGSLIDEKRLAERTDPQLIIKELRDLNTKYDDLKAGLRTEPVSSLEKQYIIRKRQMGSQLEVTHEIERSLIQARLNEYFFQVNIPIIGYALGLPLGPKILFDEHNRWKAREKLIEDFYGDESFKIYLPEIKQKFLNVIMQIATNSVASADAVSPLRVVEHWSGEGATGKSTAAKAIARFLKLPYFEKRITDPSEISTASIEGTLRSLEGQTTLGWLATALLQKGADDGESYQNGFLILDDFPVNTSNGQSILLTITDPDRKTVYNQSLQVNLDISRLNVFIISNPDFIPQGEVAPLGAMDSTFKALTSRFESIKFPEFNEEQKKESAVPYLKALVTELKPPAFHHFEYLNPMELRVTYDSDALKDMGLKKQKALLIHTGVTEDERDSITVRKLQIILKNTLTHYINDMTRQGTKFFNESEALKRRNPEGKWYTTRQDAALTGHPDAIGECIETRMSHQQYFPAGYLETLIITSRTATFYEKSGNINHAKKWWKRSLELGDWGVCSQVVKHLPFKVRVENDLDRELVEFLLRFPKDTEHGRDLVANYLCTLGILCTNSNPPDFEKAKDYLRKSVELGHDSAISSLLELGQKIEKQEEKFTLLPLSINIRNVDALKKIRDAAELFKRDPHKWVEELLADREKSWGFIEFLWDTKPRDRKETEDDLRALKERMNRFNMKEEYSKYKVLKLHIQLAQSIADTLIQFENDVVIHEKILSMAVRKKNLRKLVTHLFNLRNMKNSNENAKNLIADHKKWLGSSNLKLKPLNDIYKLNMDKQLLIWENHPV